MVKQDSTIPGEDSIFHPDNYNYSLTDVAEQLGPSGEAALLTKKGLEPAVAHEMGHIVALVSTLIEMSRALAANEHARIIENDCAGNYQRLPDDLSNAMHVHLMSMSEEINNRVYSCIDEIIKSKITE